MAVAAGTDHTCVIRTDGTAWCWGRNAHGQLGDGTTNDRTSPVQVSGSGFPRFTAITGGGGHTCALGKDGTVWCWGHNDQGQLGDGGTDNKSPVKATGVSNAAAVVTGDAHSCARLGDGSVTCWGSSVSGVNSKTPLNVKNLSNVTKLAAGGNTTCAVDGSGAVQCWGQNDQGQLGDGTTTMREMPTPMQLPPKPDGMPYAVIDVAVGAEFSCVLTMDHTVLCTGRNDQGQLGNPTINTATHKQVPGAVAIPSPAVAITAGAHFACAIDDQGRGWCWGENNDYEFANPSGQRLSPILTSYKDLRNLAGGGKHLCARSATGAVMCSGYDGSGQLGDGQRTREGRPQPVPGLKGVTSIGGGGRQMCATLGPDGTVVCWGGLNDSGQIGDGSQIARTNPTPVESVAHATKVATSGIHSCALVDDGTRAGTGTVVCWGQNAAGQLGDATVVSHSFAYPVLDVSGMPLAGVTQVEAAADRTCALAHGLVYCWGNNAGLPMMAVIPNQLPLTNVSEIAVGNDHTCAIVAGGMVACWGSNNLDQLGVPTGTGGISGSTLPVSVMGFTGADHISAGGSFTCAHLITGGVACWGFGDNGQLGGGSPARTPMPQPVINLSNPTAVGTGRDHACAIENETIACWGLDTFGQLGDDGYLSQQGKPLAVPDLSGVQQLVGGDVSTCALLKDSTVSCWGDDRDGELGDGVSASRAPIAPGLPCP